MFKMVVGEVKLCMFEMIVLWDEIIFLIIIFNYKFEDIFNVDEFGLFY